MAILLDVLVLGPKSLGVKGRRAPRPRSKGRFVARAAGMRQAGPGNLCGDLLEPWPLTDLPFTDLIGRRVPFRSNGVRCSRGASPQSDRDLRHVGPIGG